MSITYTAGASAARAAKQQHDRAVRMTQVVAKFASVLCQREVRTQLIAEGVAPAWSTSNTITFCEADLADLTTVQGVIGSKGLSLHEVSHILFTPRSGSDIVQWVLATPGLSRAFNALEDQRIETLMVGRFGEPVVPWLTAVIAQHLVQDKEHMEQSFPLIRGRKYLPVELRKAVRELYPAQDKVAELSQVIDEYRLLVFPADTEKAQPLILRYAELVKDFPPEGGCTGRSPDVYESIGDSRPLPKKEQERAKNKAQKRDEEDESEEADDESFDFGNPANDSTEESDEGEGSDSVISDEDGDEAGSEEGNEESEINAQPDADGELEGEGESNGEGKNYGDSDGASYDEDGEGEEDVVGTEVDTDSKSDVTEPNVDSNKPKELANGAETDNGNLADLLNEILDEVIQELTDDIERDIAKFNGDAELRGNNSLTPEKAEWEAGTVDPLVAQSSKSFGLELERLRSQFDPGWDRAVSSGRINVSRYLRGAKLEESFDRWSLGRDDAVDIEAVILLDSSSSMTGESEQRASGAMWGLKRALDKIGASCTVVTFHGGYGTSTRILYKAEERADSTVRRVTPKGGTNPQDALLYATRVLAQSARSVKILFTVTDGAWSNPEPSEKLIRELRYAGVLTALAYVTASKYSEYSSPIDPHESEVVARITNPSDLFILGRQLVKVATHRNLALY